MYRNVARRLILVVLCLFAVAAGAQVLRPAAAELLKDARRITWQKPAGFKKQGRNYQVLTFDGVAYIEAKDYLPYLSLSEPCRGSRLEPVLQAVETAPLGPDEEACVNKIYIGSEFEVYETSVEYVSKIAYTRAKFIPLRNRNGKIEKLLSYRLTWKQTATLSEKQSNASALFATSSVLASGDWYRIATTENGIYKIDRSFLQNMGIDVGAVDPRNIQIYGNGGEILAEENSSFHHDDLTENSIYVQGEADGSFDNSDYILFYGQSPHKWKLNAAANACTRYSRLKHFYSDTVFYFLTIGSAPGKRVQQQSSASLTPNYTVTAFDDAQAHELDAANLVKSGREMYGENFENMSSYSFAFNFPNVLADTAWIKTSVLGRRVDPGTGVPPGAFDVSYPGGSYQVTFPVTCGDFDCDVGKENTGCSSKGFVYTGGASMTITISKTYSDETGWLNYLWVMARRALTMAGNQMQFMDYRSVGPGNISQYNLTSPLAGLRVWNVTDPFSITEQLTTYQGGVHTFNVPTDTLQTFLAFDGNNYKTPRYSARVANQNLHGLQNIDYVVVAHPMFMNQAIEVADLHQQKEKFSYAVVTPQEIYNEFSSGAQDITAIRMFLRMLYKRATAGAEPKHLLIYGDGSYLYKGVSGNSNFVPTFQTTNSSSYISSKCGDDFYGLLDDSEGQFDCCGNPDGVMDIGVGRLPVRSYAEAEAVKQKIFAYYARKPLSSAGCEGVSANAEDWRNWVCLIADDPNPGGLWETTFVTQSESFASTIGANQRYNIDKIYQDAYKAVSVPGGRRYPDVVTAINNRVERGALIIGYSGHGGELGLAHEEVITVNQIQEWKNINNLPLFFTATCEFSRFDDAGRTSAGEYVLLNAEGGGIALFTTTRLAFASDGISLGSVFYPAAVNKLSNGKYPTLGDIIKKTKQAQPNYLHFTLLGDPALTLSYPKENVSTYKINSNLTVTSVNDTMSALGKYTVTGFIADTNGSKVSSFNGYIYPTIYDKPVVLSTLDNSGNGSSAILQFKLQKNALYRGKASVVNGDFEFTFIVPKDIIYNYGLGKISYYAQSDTSDAAGFYSQLVVGGTSNTPVNDNVGPTVKLFMNDHQFVPGGLTDENPYIYAEVSDSSGINTTGNGLGHDIVATLDANTARAYVLNDYYQADLNKYQSGKVKYQLSSLAEGAHNLNIKVWDILNNSSMSSTDFVVSKSAEMALAHVLNYPNPFSTATKFFVEHNQACTELDVQVQIFTITGRIVKTLQETVHNEGYRTSGIAWDGRDDFGDKLGRGVYIYKVTVKNATGSKADKIEKLVILN